MDYLIKFGFYVQFVYLYFLSFNQNVQNNDNLMFNHRCININEDDII